jgi:Uma2 family endonuclease
MVDRVVPGTTGAWRRSENESRHSGVVEPAFGNGTIGMNEHGFDEMQALGVQIPPGEDELPYSDGVPMESERHLLQMHLLIEPLKLHWSGRADGYVGGNMFVYFSLEHVKNQDFRGPDFFAVLGVPKRERKSWVVWEEKKGPDVVIELLSESTAALDKGEKKRIYQDELRVPEYFWYDPFSGELAGFSLRDGRYRPLKLDHEGRLKSAVLGLGLRRWEGVYEDVQARWLRWADEEGVPLPTRAEQEKARAEQAEARERQTQEALTAEIEARRRLESELAALRAGAREQSGGKEE